MTEHDKDELIARLREVVQLQDARIDELLSELEGYKRRAAVDARRAARKTG